MKFTFLIRLSMFSVEILSILVRPLPVGSTLIPYLSVNFTPKAWAIPIPPSTVALPPIPIITVDTPLSSAAFINSPVP